MSIGLRHTNREEVMAGLTGAAAAHLVLVMIVFLATRQVPLAGTVYRVNLVAAPAPTEARRVAPEATPRPVERTAPIDPPRPKPQVVPPPPPTKTVPQQRVEAPVETANPATPMPGETPSTGADVANVSTPGADFPFPEYLRNIVNEIYRRWQRPEGAPTLRTEVRFVVLRDGLVKDITVATGSRSFSFDLSARGAVEAAANASAFGPLPEGFIGDALAISLWFKPRGTP